MILLFLSFNSKASDTKQILSQKSVSEWWQRDFGIGVIKYKEMFTYKVIDTIFTDSNVDSKIKAILNSRSLAFTIGEDVFSFKRMIEYDYEIPGFAILKFNSDSSWAEVTLDPYNLLEPPTGWVNLKKDGTSFILWSNLLTNKNLFFLNPDDIQFYSKPNKSETNPIKLEMFINSNRYDYIMKPILRNGNWLKVEVLTPSPYCKSEEVEVSPKILWIQYLNDNQRPNVFFYTRGC